MTTKISKETKRALLNGIKQHNGRDLITPSEVDDADLHWDSLQITFTPAPRVKFYLGAMHVASMEHPGSFGPGDTLVLGDIKGTLGINLEI